MILPVISRRLKEILHGWLPAGYKDIEEKFASHSTRMGWQGVYIGVETG